MSSLIALNHAAFTDRPKPKPEVWHSSESSSSLQAVPKTTNDAPEAVVAVDHGRNTSIPDPAKLAPNGSNSNEANSTQSLITAHQAETWIPRLDEIIGNEELIRELNDRKAAGPPEGDSHILVMGKPGEGKTATLLSYSRERIAPENLYHGGDLGVFAATKGRKYAFGRIEGGTVSERRLEQFVSDAMEPALHTFVFLDEIGELFHRGLDERIRPMLDLK